MTTPSQNIAIANDRIEEVRKHRNRYLDLRGLGLNELPQDISDLKFLLDLDISYNNITLFPKDIALLENLQYLNCSNNGLEEFYLLPGKSYFYKEIDISNNHLNYVPEDLLNIGDAIVKFDNNFFMLGLPPEISQYEDLSFISFYLDSIERKEIPKRLFETKILLVGKGEVGKTTLKKILQDSNFEVKIGTEDSTHGIEINSNSLPILFPAKKPYYNRFEDFDNLFIRDAYEETSASDTSSKEALDPLSAWYFAEDPYWLEIKVSEEPFRLDKNLIFEKPVKINYWDFGGQEILYSTHQFFLTQRSLYLLVWDPRSDTENENFEYWLNIIQRLSNNSPVIVVMNKSDVRIKQIDEISLKKNFPNILDFLKVSCLTGEGIPALLNSMRKAIGSLPHIGDILPHKWDEIRNVIKKLKTDYITYEEFKTLCNIEDEEKVNYISSYLNDLGDIIHFQKDFYLKNLVIINPQWLTDAIYTLIHSVEVQKNLGRFRAEELEKLLDSKKYPSSKHIEILSLMEKFEICFKIVGSKNEFIIPSLLPSKAPELEFVEHFPSEDALKVEFQYKFLPSGIIERLICKMNNYILKNNYWKFGVIFKNEEQMALLSLNSFEKKISLKVTGDLRTKIFQFILYNFEEIHQSLNLREEDVNMFLACNCEICSTSSTPYMFNKKTLIRFLNKKKEKIDCQYSTEEVNIKTLLIGIKSYPRLRSLVRPFVNAASALQTRTSFKDSHEDIKNQYFSDLLRTQILNLGLVPNEQAQRGSSPSGKRAGELDILIEDKKGTPISIFEGLHLSSLDRKSIDLHLKKTIQNYDRNGMKEKFMGIYSLASDFENLAKKYFSHISKSKILKNPEDVSSDYSNGEEIKVFKTVISKYDNPTFLYHLLINFNFK